MPTGPKPPKTLDELTVLADLTLTDIQRFTEQDFEALLVDELEIKSVKTCAKLQRQHRELLDGLKAQAVRASLDDAASEETTAGVDIGVKDQQADAGGDVAAMVPGVDASQPVQTSALQSMQSITHEPHSPQSNVIEAGLWHLEKRGRLPLAVESTPDSPKASTTMSVGT